MTSRIGARKTGIAALTAGVAMVATSFVAAALATAPSAAAESFESRIDMMVTAPFKILASARANGISDTVPQISEAVLARVATLDEEATRLIDQPGMTNLVTSDQIEEAYAGGVQDAIRYGYGESDLQGMLDAVAAATDFRDRAETLVARVREMGIPQAPAENLGVIAISAGVHAAQRRDDRWIRALSDFVDARAYRNACPDCTEIEISASAQAAFDAMLEVNLAVEEIVLFSHNDLVDIKRAHMGQVLGERQASHSEIEP